MANVSVYNMEGKEVGTMELNDAVFGVEVNEHLVHMAVVNQLANKRQGTQKAKTRSEVSGGGKKPWRQKGTGHARQGSIRAPQWLSLIHIWRLYGTGKYAQCQNCGRWLRDDQRYLSEELQGSVLHPGGGGLL